jgi:gamma-glutamylcyclotransferase (GGCT)/AIG2-like uncharacterized protein YtfP
MNIRLSAEDIKAGRSFVIEHGSDLSPVGDPLFVYGTLKNGGHNHRFLGNCRFLGEAETVLSFPFQHIEVYPVPGKGHRVQGEVWVPRDASAWRALDQLEGHPTYYRRLKTQVEIKIKNQDGVTNKIIETWIYFYMFAQSGDLVKCQKSYKIY